jgi:membrane associated rhomboid family serine protease
MIPIQDTIRSERWPLVNYALIALCAYAFWLELSAGPDIDVFVNEHALVPARFVKSIARSGFELSLFAPFVTSMFLHGGITHFLGNMLFLWIFGDNVEDRMGHLGYALFYLAGGVAASATHVLANPASVVPTVGASGAIAAVMGAYMLLYPASRIVTLVIVVFIVRTVEVPAFAWLGLWFVFQLLASGVGSGAADHGGVAVFAHIGGFAFGAAVVLLFGLREGK